MDMNDNKDEPPREHWSDQLSSYLDGELDGPDRDVLQGHLAICAECRRTLGELEAVKSWLRSDSPDVADVRAAESWSRVRARLAPRGWRERATWMRPSSIAAALTLFAFLGTAWWNSQTTLSAPSPLPIAAPATVESRAATELEQVVRERIAMLPPEKTRSLEASLRIIERAIADASAAQRADPSDDFVATYLDGLWKRKVDALRAVVEIVDAEAS